MMCPGRLHHPRSRRHRLRRRGHLHRRILRTRLRLHRSHPGRHHRRRRRPTLLYRLRRRRLRHVPHVGGPDELRLARGGLRPRAGLRDERRAARLEVVSRADDRLALVERLQVEVCGPALGLEAWRDLAHARRGEAVELHAARRSGWLLLVRGPPPLEAGGAAVVLAGGERRAGSLLVKVLEPDRHLGDAAATLLLLARRHAVCLLLLLERGQEALDPAPRERVDGAADGGGDGAPHRTVRAHLCDPLVLGRSKRLVLERAFAVVEVVVGGLLDRLVGGGSRRTLGALGRRAHVWVDPALWRLGKAAWSALAVMLESAQAVGVAEAAVEPLAAVGAEPVALGHVLERRVQAEPVVGGVAPGSIAAEQLVSRGVVSTAALAELRDAGGGELERAVRPALLLRSRPPPLVPVAELLCNDLRHRPSVALLVILVGNEAELAAALNDKVGDGLLLQDPRVHREQHQPTVLPPPLRGHRHIPLPRLLDLAPSAESLLERRRVRDGLCIGRLRL
mmetsp:Transcript_37214/g.122767  ORF Transcript_37214/g.122767 Transcript_37214/m.122767 type:complete len:508 (-) Transcript_37214:307-1830(-)